MKISSKVLLGASGALIAAFAVKNVVNYSRYTKTVNSAPFDITISLNALVLVVPAAVLAAIAFFSERNTRVLAISAAVFAAVSVEEFIRHIDFERFIMLDGLLFAIPYLAAAVIFTAFLIVLMVRKRG